MGVPQTHNEWKDVVYTPMGVHKTSCGEWVFIRLPTYKIAKPPIFTVWPQSCVPLGALKEIEDTISKALYEITAVSHDLDSGNMGRCDVCDINAIKHSTLRKDFKELLYVYCLKLIKERVWLLCLT